MDITEQKRAERALRGSEPNLRLILDSIPAPAALMTPSGEVETVNEPSLKYFGKTSEDLRKWGTSDAVHPDDLPHAIEIWMEAIRTGEPYLVKQRLRRFDGVYRWFDVRGFPLRDPDGRILNWCVLLTDIDDRERAEEALRVLVETAPDAVISADGSGLIQFANPATTRVFGYAPAELIGRPLTVLMPQFMRNLHENAFRRYLITGQRQINWQGTEFTGLRKNGQEFPIEISFGEIVTESGHTFTGFIRDVSARKRVEENLRRSEQRWRAVFENSAIGVALTDMTGGFLATNSAYQQMLGYSEEELTKLTFFDLTLEEDRKRNETLVSELRDGKRMQFQIEKRYRRKDGRLIWVSNNVSLVTGTEDSPRFVMALSEDITERKRAEDTFRLIVAGTAATTGRDFFHSLVRHMAQALCARYALVTACDDQKHARTLAFWKGDRFGENFDFDIADTPCEKVLHGEVCHFREGLRGRFPLDKFLTDWKADSYLGVPMLDRSNRVIGHMAILDPKPMEADSHTIDLLKIFASRAAAELKRQKAEDALQEALEERERMREELADLVHLNRVSTMGELAASLAHEIKQPISAALTDAKTCLRWLSRDEPNVPEAQEAASRLVKDAIRVTEIVDRIGLLFRKGSLQRESIQVNQIIQEMVALLGIEAARYSIRIHSDLTNGLPEIHADRVQVQQVLMNLMLNGIEAMKDLGSGGDLTIRSRQENDGQILVSVRDTGVGLRSEHEEKIFNAFFTTKPQGTGMGLAISRSIIESHGGRLWATSSTGPGATFQFTLPNESKMREAVTSDN
ncbi:MAG TPA: PAS domain S-box protein [Acidobacteriaceae bacterium]|jgi:PAS domain S-box-containing protein